LIVSGKNSYLDKNCFDFSYVQKNRAALGAEPIAAAFKPL
jgi:hypothetical protein